MFSIAMKNASFSLRSDYIEYLAGCQLKHFSLILLLSWAGGENVFPIMQKKQEKGKRDLSTRLSYDEKEACRTFKNWT
ncbi:hypothetical protein CYJ37_26515 [Bacillus sp. UMB0728]|nr:hypothetical protein CYJ37_26515 [Bacillus sp. UMB0728]